jgi:hypothetical protein
LPGLAGPTSVVYRGSSIFRSLGLGIAGYHVLENQPWFDAFVNAAMILSGMGPLSPLQTSAGKLFAGAYALFSRLAFITAMGVVFAPVFHRFLHAFHLDAGTDQPRDRSNSE